MNGECGFNCLMKEMPHISSMSVFNVGGQYLLSGQRSVLVVHDLRGVGLDVVRYGVHGF